MNRKSAYNVPNLERALAVMELLSKHPEGLTRTEMADALEIPSNSAYRISMSLMENGYITRMEGSKKFFLGDKLLDLKCTVIDEQSLVAVSWDVMRELRNVIGESVFLAVRNNARCVILERIEGLHDVKLTLRRGHTFDLCGGVAGKVIMAHLPDEERNLLVSKMSFDRCTRNTITTKTAFLKELKVVRERGYGLDCEECMYGLNCVGAPILDETGYPVAALYTIALVHCLNESNFDRVGQTMIEYTQRIATKLKHGSEV